MAGTAISQRPIPSPSALFWSPPFNHSRDDQSTLGGAVELIKGQMGDGNITWTAPLMNVCARAILGLG